MKKLFKVPFCIIMFLLISTFFVFVHELSHLIVSLSFGNPLEKVIFMNAMEGNFFTFGIGLVINRINEDAILWVSISGSIGTIIVCILFLILAFKKRSVVYTFIIFISIINEFTYYCNVWFIYPIFM